MKTNEHPFKNELTPQTLCLQIIYLLFINVQTGFGIRQPKRVDIPLNQSTNQPAQ